MIIPLDYMATNEVLNFPRDVWRRKWCVDEHSEHQAKLEMQTLDWIIRRYTEPGDTILDPMSGIGTVHYAATLGRDTIALELVPRFFEIQGMNIQKMQEVSGGLTGHVHRYEGDCRMFLPLPNDHISLKPNIVIFSPPYGDLWKVAGKSKFHTEKHINIGYDAQHANVGQLTNYPLYLEAMKTIYTLCNRSLVIGEMLIIITKDYVRQKRHIEVGRDNTRVAIDAGFLPFDWHYRYTDPKIFQIIHRKRREESGEDQDISLKIDYEDIIVLRKMWDA